VFVGGRTNDLRELREDFQHGFSILTVALYELADYGRSRIAVEDAPVPPERAVTTRFSDERQHAPEHNFLPRFFGYEPKAANLLQIPKQIAVLFVSSPAMADLGEILMEAIEKRLSMAFLQVDHRPRSDGNPRKKKIEAISTDPFLKNLRDR
jgi:hypothetical protein